MQRRDGECLEESAHTIQAQHTVWNSKLRINKRLHVRACRRARIRTNSIMRVVLNNPIDEVVELARRDAQHIGIKTLEAWLHLAFRHTVFDGI